MGAPNLALIVSLISALLTAAICLRAAEIANRTGLIDRPDGSRKLHSEDTPLVGGLAVLFPTFALALVYFGIEGMEPFVASALVACAVILAVGIEDDRVSLSVHVRFLALAGVVLSALFVEPLFILHALRLKTLGFEIGFGIFAVPITLTILVGFVNAVNMADGINGQLLGSVLVWCSFIIIYSHPETRMPFFVLMASSSVALVFNLKGKLFSGSAGSYALPLFVGLSAIAVYRYSNGRLSAELPALWFWLPVVDCVRLFAWRMAKRRSPFSSDRNHLHHVLLENLGPQGALIAYLILLAIPGLVAIQNDSWGDVALLLCLSCYIFAIGGGMARLRSGLSRGKGLPHAKTENGGIG